jgi:hypothetical protein
MRYHFLPLAICAISGLFGAENILAPNGKVNLTLPPMGDRNAFSFLGEFGAKNIRGSGTYGSYINPCNRIKFTGELLLQKLDYHFISEIQKKWMTQYSVGGAYQYLILHDLFQSIDFAISFSHSFKRNIRSAVDIPGRVAGSDAGLSSLGTTLNIWDCGFLALALTYDYVKYHRIYESPKLANGVGGAIHFYQYLPLGFSLEGEADFRRPYYYYSGIANWHCEFDNWAVDCGGYVNYTNGRKSLPNVLASGIQIGLTSPIPISAVGL